MDLGTLGMVFGWLLHLDPGCVVCNWDPVSHSWIPAAATGAAAGGGLGLNDLFQENSDGTVSETPGGGVGDTSNPNYSDTTAEDRIAQDEAQQQLSNEYYRATHPGATTAGPPQQGKQAGAFFHRAVVEHIKHDGAPAGQCGRRTVRGS